MSCCCQHQRVAPTKPEQRGLTNLAYLELLDTIDEMKVHADRVHKRWQWICRYFWHDWRKVVDDEYDTHAVCHRCGKYQPTSWANPGGVYNEE